MTNEDWLCEAYIEATASNDPSTQNGAILVDYAGHVIARSCNQFPMRVRETGARWQRPEKYAYVEHAERNAIYQAAFVGRATHLGTLYCPWAACADCARAIIQAGIKRLVRHVDALEHGAGRNWDETIRVADAMLTEADVEIVDVAGPLGAEKIRHSGELWSP